MNDFLKPAKISQSELEGNLYFAERWWEVDQWEYREDIMVCLISAEDALGMDKSKRVFVDIRSFQSFNEGYIKSSYYMDPENSKLFELYAEFLSLYNENYPENLICIVGTRDNPGHIFA